MAEGSAEKLRVIDPHFHVWNIPRRENANLGDMKEKLPVYDFAAYSDDMKGVESLGMTFENCVHVETVVGQEEGGAFVDTLEESRELKDIDGSMGVVVYLPLWKGEKAAVECLDGHLEVLGKDVIKGVRMILNFEPSWPQVTRDFVGEDDDAFTKGFESTIVAKDLVFDLQANPHQLGPFASWLERHGWAEKVTVVLNHLGCLKDPVGDREVWRSGMEALSKLPKVYVKLSMLGYTFGADWARDPERVRAATSLVHEALSIFGPDRCMFASNYPVDKVDGLTIPELYSAFQTMASKYTASEQQSLFADTAKKVYRL